MVSLEWFLSPDLYSKPIDKHIYINNKKKNKPHWIYKTFTPFWLGIRARWICSTDEGYFGRKNITQMSVFYQGGWESRFKNPTLRFFNYRKTNKKCNSVPYLLSYSRGLPIIHKILHKETSKIKPVF